MENVDKFGRSGENRGSRWKFEVWKMSIWSCGMRARIDPADWWSTLVAALVVFQLSACATTATTPATLPGNTRASPKTQREAEQMIFVLDGAGDTSCNERKVVNTELRKLATVDEYVAVERWTIDRCGKLIRYQVIFRPNPNGGTEFSVNLEPPS
jgi:hypothetical protein